MAIIIIPAALRKFTDANPKVEIDGVNVEEVIKKLTTIYPLIKPLLLNRSGRVPAFINIFVDSQDVRTLQQNQTCVQAQSVISIVPAIAGG